MVEIIVACLTLAGSLVGGFFLIVKYLNRQNAKMVENARIDSLHREKVLLEMVEKGTQTIEEGRKEMIIAYREVGSTITAFKMVLENKKKW